MTTYGGYVEEVKGEWFFDIVADHPVCDAFADCASDADRFKIVDDFVSKRFVMKVKPDPRGKSKVEANRVRELGNASFRKEDFLKALRAYSRSIIVAPWPSLSLALAFGNRSVVLYKTKRYAEAIADIDRALKHGYPGKAKIKLLLRKADCYIEAGCFKQAVDFLETTFGRHDGDDDIIQDDDRVSVLERLKKSRDGLKGQNGLQVGCGLKPLHPTTADKLAELGKLPLAGGQNPVFLSASSLVGLAYTPEMGRHLVAAEDIPVGAVLIKDPCFVQGMTKCCVNTNCYTCHMWTDVAVPCPGCTKAVYCSEECANGPQAALHAKECSFLWQFYKDRDNQDIIEQTLLVVRTLLKKTAEEWREFSGRFPGNLQGDVRAFKAIPKLLYDPQDYDNVYCFCKGSEIPLVGNKQLQNAFRAVYVMKLLDKVGVFGPPLEPGLYKFLGGVALRHFANFMINSEFSWDWCDPPPTNYEERRFITGRVIHPTVELLNHGCDSNVAVARFANVSVVRAIRNVKKGEPLLRGFSPSPFLGMSIDVRQRTLLNQSDYMCHCRVCEEDWPTLDDMYVEYGYQVDCKECKHRFVCKIDSGVNEECPKCGWSCLEALGKVVLLDLLTTVHPWDELVLLTDEVQEVFAPPNLVFADFDQAIRSAWMCQGNKRPVLAGDKGNPPCKVIKSCC